MVVQRTCHVLGKPTALVDVRGSASVSLHFGPADHRPDNQAVLNFPRSIADDSLFSKCHTGWMRVEPGSGKDTEALGYVQIDLAGRQLAVYHLWGEI